MEFYHTDQLNYIGGEFTASVSGHWIENICPSTEESLGQVARSNERDVEIAVDAACQSKRLWASVSSMERGRILYKIVESMERNSNELASIVARESGKSFKDAKGEVGAAIAQGQFMAGEGARLAGRLAPSNSTGKTVLVKKTPIGVAGLIVAFNTPIANVTWKVFPALISGNTVVLKSSEDTPATATYFAKLIHESGVPHGVFNLIHGTGKEAGQAIVENRRIDVLSFTGSTRVGEEIATTIGPRLTKLFLELGGKNPLVVCEDANLDLALDWCLKSSFSNAGQRCAASSRIIVQDSIYESFKAKFTCKALELKLGTGDADDLGPVINKRQLQRMLDHIEDAKGRGVEVVVGGKVPSHISKGYYLEPTILENASLDDPISKEELFGPITNLYSFSDLDEAISIANTCDYGLTACIHTKDIDKAMYFSDLCEAGVVNVNGGTHGSEPHLPFGGVKKSGNGLREPGLEALEVYTNTKVISLNVTGSL